MQAFSRRYGGSTGAPIDMLKACLMKSRQAIRVSNAGLTMMQVLRVTAIASIGHLKVHGKSLAMHKLPVLRLVTTG